MKLRHSLISKAGRAGGTARPESEVFLTRDDLVVCLLIYDNALFITSWITPYLVGGGDKTSECL